MIELAAEIRAQLRRKSEKKSFRKSRQKLLEIAVAIECAHKALKDGEEWQRQAIYHNKKHGEMLTEVRRLRKIIEDANLEIPEASQADS